MTAAEELTLLETQYSAWIDAGCPSSYSINGGGGGQSVGKDHWRFLIERMDKLRSAIARETTGAFLAAQFRRPE